MSPNFGPLLFLLSCNKPQIDPIFPKHSDWQLEWASALHITSELLAIQNSPIPKAPPKTWTSLENHQAFSVLPIPIQAKSTILAKWHPKSVDILTEIPPDCIAGTLQSDQHPPIEFTSDKSGALRMSLEIQRSIQKLNLEIHCETQWHRSQSILRKNSQELPQIWLSPQWQQNQQNQVTLSHAQGQTMTVEFRRLGQHKDPSHPQNAIIGFGENGDWQTLGEKTITAPFEAWNLNITPSMSTMGELKISLHHDAFTESYTHVIRPADQIWVLPTEPTQLDEQVNIQVWMNHNLHPIVRLSLQSANHQSSQALIASTKMNNFFRFFPMDSGWHHLEFLMGTGETHVDFQVFDIQEDTLFAPNNASSQTIPTLPADSPSTESPSLTILHAPTFLRLQDQILIEKIEKDHLIQKAIRAEHLEQQDLPSKIILSPNDRIWMIDQIATVVNQSQNIPITVPQNGYPTYLSTDNQIHDRRITQLFMHLFEGHHPEQDSEFIYQVALLWDGLASRNLPWLDAVLQRSKEDLQYLEELYQSSLWQELEPLHYTKITWALFIAEQKGLKPSTRLLKGSIDTLCRTKDESKASVMTDHLLYLLSQSDWRYLQCGEGTPLCAQPTYQAQCQAIDDAIQLGLQEKTLPQFSNHLDWFLEWMVWEKEANSLQRYSKVSLRLLQNSTLIDRGLLHNWQLHNLTSKLDANTDNYHLQIQGMGRVYWALWQIQPQQRVFYSNHPNALSIERMLLNHQEQSIAANKLRKGEEIIIRHHIKGAPNQRFSIVRFAASGLGHQQNGPMESFWIQSDEDGEALWDEKTYVEFEGQFSLPGIHLSDGSHFANSEDWILETTKL